VKSLLLTFACLSVGSGLALAQKLDQLEPTLKLVVMVNAQLGGTPVFGAGIVFRREKDRLYIVTANHVVRRGPADATNIRVALRSAPGRSLAAKLLPQTDREQDIAILSVEGSTLQGIDVCAIPFDRVGDLSALKRGDSVIPVGNPNGTAWGMPVIADRISNVNGDEITFQSATIAIGVSGGALLDGQSHLIGMVLRDEPPYGQAIGLAKVLNTVGQWYPVQIRIATPECCGSVPATDSSTPLHAAAAKGDAIQVKALLAEACSQVDPKTFYGYTPLDKAAQSGSAEVVRLLRDSGAKLDPFVLNFAVKSGSLETVKLLLASGARVNGGRPDDTPLRSAIEAGQPEMVALLIGERASINGMLEVAASNRNPVFVRQLLAAGAKVNDPSSTGASALEVAIQNGNVETMRLLIAAGADVNVRRSRNSDTLLHLSAGEGRADAIRLLLQAGAKVNAEGQSEQTPLYDAVKAGQLDSVKLLLAAGADVQAKGPGSNGSHSGNTPICEAYAERHAVRTAAVTTTQLNILKTLVEHSDASLNGLISREGCRLFDWAAGDGDAEVVKALLAGGANPNAPGVRPLISAAEHGQAEVARILVAAKTNLNATDVNGQTALHGTVADGTSDRGRRMEVARVLLAAGANVNTALSYNRSTPLHEAVAHGAPLDILKLLLKAGASVDALDQGLQTPLSLARSKDPAIAALLAPYSRVSQRKNGPSGKLRL
jgi:ankyrin repeat protein